MEADISGSQRKVIAHSVRPLRSGLGAQGITVRRGRAQPFTVTRSWSAPAGFYGEQWFLVEPDTRRVVFEGPLQMALLRGLQAPTRLTDEVRTSFKVEPGSYKLVFALDGLQGGEVDVQVLEAPSEEAA